MNLNALQSPDNLVFFGFTGSSYRGYSPEKTSSAFMQRIWTESWQKIL